MRLRRKPAVSRGAPRARALVGNGTLAIALALGGCAGVGDGLMVPVPPPASWAEQILEARAEKDRAFAGGADSPLLPEDRERFRGLDYWGPDPRLRFAGPIHLYAERDAFRIPTTAGKLRPAEKYGWLAFEIDGVRCSLQVYRMLDAAPGDAGLFLPFADATTGTETYPAGRYVDLEGSGGIWVLDFNRAYNPFCAYGSPERYACPVTPPENRLPVRIEAGERGYRVAS